jgi:subtilisin-like proprotein convertase family protein
LIIKIISPNGTSVVLQNRNGGGAKNINQTYDLQNTPSISSLKGESVNGDWLLQIVDAAAIDTGTLNKWSLTISLMQEQSVILNDSPGITIPDNDPTGIERSLNTPDEGTIKEVEVGVDITHSYISDLIINLVPPHGSVITLHNRTGGSADNIITTYDFNNNINLKSLKGEKVQGMWKLQVADFGNQDVGKLNKWSLKLVKE